MELDREHTDALVDAAGDYFLRPSPLERMMGIEQINKQIEDIEKKYESLKERINND